MSAPPAEFCQLLQPSDVSVRLRDQLMDCWIEVSNAGGPVGFAVPPVSPLHVAPVLDSYIAALHPERFRIVAAVLDDRLAGWVCLSLSTNRLTRYWAEVRHLQTRPDCRGRGIGSALLDTCARVAHKELDLDALHLAVRAGVGLERFYTARGWREIGHWSGARHLGPDGHRDEAMMQLELR
jgi:GNAT superfamily N-acetyltransferase